MGRVVYWGRWRTVRSLALVFQELGEGDHAAIARTGVVIKHLDFVECVFQIVVGFDEICFVPAGEVLLTTVKLAQDMVALVFDRLDDREEGTRREVGHNLVI